MFSPDSPVISFLGKIADLIIINLLVIICSLPIFTIGASWTAMYYVTVKMVKNEESYVTRDFFKSFRLNFRQATVIWLINLIILLIMGADALIIKKWMPQEIPEVIQALMTVFSIFLAAVMIYVYPVLSRFDNSVRNTIKNAFLLSISNLPYTLLFAVILAVPVGVAFLTNFGFRILPVYLLIGISGPAYLCSIGWKKIFDKLEPQTETEPIGDSDGKQEEEKAETESE